MRYCLKCGSEFQDWVDKCLDCGSQTCDTRLRDTNTPVQPVKNEENDEVNPLVCIASAGSEAEASLLCGMLENEGIPATFFPALPNVPYSAFSIADPAQPFRILVRASDEEKARDIVVPLEDAGEDEF